MDRFTSYSGNGYEERKSQEFRSLNNRVTYYKEQKKLKAEENKLNRINRGIRNEEKVEKMKHEHTPSLAQNHLKLPGNNQFK